MNMRFWTLCTVVALACAPVWAAPNPMSVDPPTGSCSGGTYSIVSGEGFNEFGTTTVTFGGAPATDVSVFRGYGDVLYVICTSPPHAPGLVDIVVTNSQDGSGTLAHAFTYQVSVLTVRVYDPLHVDVTFDGPVGSGALTPGNYALSGAGRGTLATQPETVTNVGGNVYRLAWSSGDMVDGGDVTVTVSGMLDSTGQPLVDPLSGTDEGGGVPAPPTVASVAVHSALDVDVTFSEPVDGGALIAAYYTISGSGQGTLAAHPGSVALVSGSTYQLTWSTGEMHTAGDVTISAVNVNDLAGNPIGTPNNGTHTGGGIGVRPTVTDVAVQTGLTVDVTFSEPMGSGVTTPANYTVSGAGRGALVDHPASVALVIGNKYRLTWTAGEMVNGGNVTITVANAQDLAGNAVGSPNSAMHTGGGLGVAPAVQTVLVHSGTSVDVTFSESMGAGATTQANYTLSGSGKGTLADHPDSVALVSGATYRLAWTNGGMVNGGNITITVASGAHDLAGNGLGAPNSGTHVGGGMASLLTADAIAPLASPVSSPVGFSVTFNKLVQHFNNAADLVIVETGGVAHSGVSVTGGPQTFSVYLTGVTGNGTVTLAVSTESDVQDLDGNGLSSSVTSVPVTVDNAPPAVDAVTATTPSPTNGHSVQFTVAFGEDVQHFDGADSVLITETGSVTHSGVTITGGPRNYGVQIDGVNGNGTLTLAVSTVSDVQDLAANPVESSPTSSAVTVDHAVPRTITITSNTASPTRGGTIGFAVTFTEPVQLFDAAADLVVTETGTVAHTGASITGGPEEYTVNLTGVTGSGTMALAANTASDVSDPAGNALASSVTSASVTVDGAAPRAQSISLLSASPTNASTLSLAISFSEAVQGFDAESDLVIVKTGSLAYGGVIITGGPQAYVASLTDVHGNGTATVSVNLASNVQDPAGNPLASSATSPTITVDQTAPTVAIQLQTPSPTQADAVVFGVDFSESVTPAFSASAVTVNGSLAGAVNVDIASKGSSYTVTVTPIDPNADGAIGISVGPGLADAAGNGCVTSASAVCSVYNWYGFTEQPQPVHAYAGDPVSFHATPHCGSPVFGYQWQWDDGAKAVHTVGANAPEYTIPSADGASRGEYWCIVTYDSVAHPSAKATLNVADHLAISGQPQGGAEPMGASHTFNVSVQGGYEPIAYTWKKDGAPIPNATDASYTIPYLGAADGGTYLVEVADDNGDFEVSSPARLTVGVAMPLDTVIGIALLAGVLAALAGRRIFAGTRP